MCRWMIGNRLLPQQPPYMSCLSVCACRCVINSGLSNPLLSLRLHVCLCISLRLPPCDVTAIITHTTSSEDKAASGVTQQFLCLLAEGEEIIPALIYGWTCSSKFGTNYEKKFIASTDILMRRGVIDSRDSLMLADTRSHWSSDSHCHGSRFVLLTDHWTLLCITSRYLTLHHAAIKRRTVF